MLISSGAGQAMLPAGCHLLEVRIEAMRLVLARCSSRVRFLQLRIDAHMEVAGCWWGCVPTSAFYVAAFCAAKLLVARLVEHPMRLPWKFVLAFC